MQCSSLPIPGPCISCKNPFDYFFEIVYLSTKGINTRVSFAEAFVEILDIGIRMPNCDNCCPNCGIYVLGSVETFLKYAEFSSYDLNPNCCLNPYGSVETYLKYLEGMSVDPNERNGNCCDPRFDLCVNKMICWGIEGSSSGSNFLDRILDKGVIEFGNFTDNCTNINYSGLCSIIDYLKSKDDLYLGVYREEFIDILLDRGFIVACEDGDIFIGSLETYTKYAEAVG